MLPLPEMVKEVPLIAKSPSLSRLIVPVLKTLDLALIAASIEVTARGEAIEHIRDRLGVADFIGTGELC